MMKDFHTHGVHGNVPTAESENTLRLAAKRTEAVDRPNPIRSIDDDAARGAVLSMARRARECFSKARRTAMFTTLLRGTLRRRYRSHHVFIAAPELPTAGRLTKRWRPRSSEVCRAQGDSH